MPAGGSHPSSEPLAGSAHLRISADTVLPCFSHGTAGRGWSGGRAGRRAGGWSGGRAGGRASRRAGGQAGGRAAEEPSGTGPSSDLTLPFYTGSEWPVSGRPSSQSSSGARIGPLPIPANSKSNAN